MSLSEHLVDKSIYREFFSIKKDLDDKFNNKRLENSSNKCDVLSFNDLDVDINNKKDKNILNSKAKNYNKNKIK